MATRPLGPELDFCFLCAAFSRPLAAAGSSDSDVEDSDDDCSESEMSSFFFGFFFAFFASVLSRFFALEERGGLAEGGAMRMCDEKGAHH